MRNKLLLLLSVLVIGAMALAACGGGLPTEATAAPTGETPVPPPQPPAARMSAHLAHSNAKPRQRFHAKVRAQRLCGTCAVEREIRHGG